MDKREVLTTLPPSVLPKVRKSYDMLVAATVDHQQAQKDIGVAVAAATAAEARMGTASNGHFLLLSAVTGVDDLEGAKVDFETGEVWREPRGGPEEGTDEAPADPVEDALEEATSIE